MGFWHTGYAEFHEPSGLEDYVYSPPPPVRYVCEHCSASFLELELLRRHRFEKHPVRQPALWIRGRAVGALPQKLMSTLKPSEVVVEDTTGCLVNGKTVALKELGQHLASMKREFVEVQLSNAGATTRCELDFCIADVDHLVGVESAFLRVARDHELSVAALARFITECQAYPSAMPYCDGICQYLYGVMAKEGSPDSGLKKNQYVGKYLLASETLSDFDRPLARSVRALVAFHFNQFQEAELLAPKGALRSAASTFLRSLQGHSWHFDVAQSMVSDSAIEDLLTDQDTLQILSDARHGLIELKHQADELLNHLMRATTGGYDQMKRVILASEALAARSDESSHVSARKLAREWSSHHDTSVWAQAMLDRLKKP